MADGLLWIAQALTEEAPVIPLPLAKKPSSESRRSRRSKTRSSNASSRGSSASSRESLRSIKGASARHKAAASARRPTLGEGRSKSGHSMTGSESDLPQKSQKTRLVVARMPKKGEKYTPPPRGTFRSSYAPLLRSEAIFQFVTASSSRIHTSKPNSPTSGSLTSQTQALDADVGVNSGDLSTMLAIAVDADMHVANKSVAKAAPFGPLTEEQSLALQQLRDQVANMPVLSVSEFDLFSSERFRRDPLVRETSEVWERSPKAPPPPKVRRWLREARRRETAFLEEVQESNTNSLQGSPKAGLRSI